MNNMRINRITFFVFGIIFFLLGFFAPLFFFIGGALVALAYLTNKKYKELANTPEPAPVTDSVVEVSEKVKIIDLSGDELLVSPVMMLNDPNRVLTVPDGHTYHTHVGCYKNWSHEMQANFTGWVMIKKSEAISRGLRYCKFCEENDNTTLDDILDDLERESDEEL